MLYISDYEVCNMILAVANTKGGYGQDHHRLSPSFGQIKGWAGRLACGC